MSEAERGRGGREVREVRKRWRRDERRGHLSGLEMDPAGGIGRWNQKLWREKRGRR